MSINILIEYKVKKQNNDLLHKTHTHTEILSNLEQNLSTAVVYFLGEISSISVSQKPVNGVLQMSMCLGVGHQCSFPELSILSPATLVRQSRRSKGVL